ncbi:hypothetical protein GCM10010178_42550 [Lentzea flava]|uniref:Uncharacterized protein n=1 Tax=Lentzea flava TaxID=103732 RepID=A0ABQ2UPB7_9PSEU|nr:hypothetical protein GCM10010178_42550 [Lentzea flava]
MFHADYGIGMWPWTRKKKLTLAEFESAARTLDSYWGIKTDLSGRWIERPRPVRRWWAPWRRRTSTDR